MILPSSLLLALLVTSPLSSFGSPASPLSLPLMGSPRSLFLPSPLLDCIRRIDDPLRGDVRVAALASVASTVTMIWDWGSLHTGEKQSIRAMT